jgi:hypothetical protein
MMLIWAITDRRGMPKVQKAMGAGDVCSVQPPKLNARNMVMQTAKYRASGPLATGDKAPESYLRYLTVSPTAQPVSNGCCPSLAGSVALAAFRSWRWPPA